MVWYACSIPLFRNDHNDRTRVVRDYCPLQVFIKMLVMIIFRMGDFKLRFFPE